jgi:hypothetical protein
MSEVIIMPAAAKILDKPENAYWRIKNEDACHIKTLMVDAVSFPEEDACRLAGAFDRFYGLVYIQKATQAKPLAVINQETEKLMREAVIYLPYSLRKKIEDEFGTNGCEHWWNETTRHSISGIDINAGADWSGYKKSGNRCSLFANTEKGLKRLFGSLTDKDWREVDQHLKPRIEAACLEIERVVFCEEKPYQLRLQGSDDTSYSLTVKTLEEAKQLLRDLHDYGFSVVDEQMHFTN